MTPEGRVKEQVKRLLSRYRSLYSYWPVPTGYGPSSLDCLIGFCGRMIAVETKAPGQKLTPRQSYTRWEMCNAGVMVFVIDGTEKTNTIKELEAYLNLLRDTHGDETLPIGDAAEADCHPGRH